ncbi:MAG TPA: alpha-amylase/4-alpha-glucanotransferase domain-containing protein [Terriglobia bacterium]
MSPVSLVLVLHSHQPVGNFDHVIEEAYRKSYQPFLEALAEHPQVRVSLHYSGHLLEWIENHHPEFFSKLRSMVERGQVEMVGGGYYEPILPSIPDRDKMAQLAKLREYIGSRFGVAPRGAWLAERVWEPSLARPLAEAGVDYIVLDDTHFLAAGVEARDLRGYYVTEDAGCLLRLLPSVKTLRYTIPFRDTSETLDLLRQGLAGAESSPLFCMGDDMEKFGGWPGTFEHCYRDGWLEGFFQALEQSADWLQVATASEYVAVNPPLGRTYLPTASYEEMMFWALPLEAAREFKACLEESSKLPGAEHFHRFLRGGFWRHFLAKYPESNQVHKLMLDVSRRLQSARTSADAREFETTLAEAETHLLASQCNDSYWHGIFGGLYTPHLRTGVLRHLIQAESALDTIEIGPGPGLRVRPIDFDCDGHREVLVEDALYSLVLRPADGGTVSSLRFKPAKTELINSLTRRREVYHDEVQAASRAESADAGQPASIHDLVASKEPNLAAFLHYDRYRRYAFRTYAFLASKQWQDYESLTLGESQGLAGGAWALVPPRSEIQGDLDGFELERASSVETAGAQWAIRAAKSLTTQAAGATWRLECHSRFDGSQLTSAAPAEESSLAFGLELVFNLLAPEAPGRYFRSAAGDGNRTEPLRFRGELSGSELLVVDEWQGVRISLTAEPEPVWWITPIETVSQSESGFERVYQGSAILAVWRPKISLSLSSALKPAFESRLRMKIQSWKPV